MRFDAPGAGSGNGRSPLQPGEPIARAPSLRGKLPRRDPLPGAGPARSPGGPRRSDGHRDPGLDPGSRARFVCSGPDVSSQSVSPGQWPPRGNIVGRSIAVTMHPLNPNSGVFPMETPAFGADARRYLAAADRAGGLEGGELRPESRRDTGHPVWACIRLQSGGMQALAIRCDRSGSAWADRPGSIPGMECLAAPGG